MIKAVAQAFRRRKMLETGRHVTVVEIAAEENINESYAGRVLRVTLVAPDIVEAILYRRPPAVLQLDDLLSKFSVEWEIQRNWFGLTVVKSD